LYPNIHDLREELITRFTNNRVVILPQTIFFKSDANCERAAAAFRNHPDLHFFIRDKVSQQIARRFTNNVYLAPDMAHQLYPIVPTDTGTGVLRIARVDDEKPVTPEALKDLHFDTRTDWVELLGSENKLIHLGWRAHGGFKSRKWDTALKLMIRWYWLPVAQRFSNKAIALFSRHDHIVTDRLHGHILSCLMDKKHTVIDNSYGKNTAYMNEWTGESELVRLAKVETCASPT
jgi:pyruvyl transferase EpsO